MKSLRLFFATILCMTSLAAFAQAKSESDFREKLKGLRWPADKAHAYMEPYGVIKGCNYVPGYCKSPMQHFIDFRENNIRRELGYARNVGLNSIRLWIPCFAWQDNKEDFYKKLDKYIEICDELDISIMATFTCYSIKDSSYTERLRVERDQRFYPGVHIQPLQIKGVRGRKTSDWPVIKEYFQDVIKRYQGNKSIIIWDLYNEAWDRDQELLDNLFLWSREANPDKPLTACWRAHDYSDVITFHTYQPPGGGKREELPGLLSFEEELDYALSYNRPVLCTEWLARTFGNNFQNVLPSFAANNIGFYFWGLVAGSGQYRFPWNWPEGAPEPYLWFHEILYPDGHPYKSEEIDLIRQFDYVKKNNL